MQSGQPEVSTRSVTLNHSPAWEPRGLGAWGPGDTTRSAPWGMNDPVQMPCERMTGGNGGGQCPPPNRSIDWGNLPTRSQLQQKIPRCLRWSSNRPLFAAGVLAVGHPLVEFLTTRAKTNPSWEEGSPPSHGPADVSHRRSRWQIR